MAAARAHGRPPVARPEAQSAIYMESHPTVTIRLELCHPDSALVVVVLLRWIFSRIRRAGCSALRLTSCHGTQRHNTAEALMPFRPGRLVFHHPNAVDEARCSLL